MRHRLGLRKLNRTSSHRLAMLRNMTNSRRPIQRLEDLQNLKFRVLPTPVMLAAFKAMGAFAVEDALLKRATQALPLGQVLIFFGVCGASLFAWRARRDGTALLHPDRVTAVSRSRYG